MNARTILVVATIVSVVSVALIARAAGVVAGVCAATLFTGAMWLLHKRLD